MTGAPYSEAFKNQMVSKLVKPGAVSARDLSVEVGVPQSTLYRWIRRAGSVGPTLAKKTLEPSEPAAIERAGGKKERSTQDKLRLLLESSSLPPEELGAFLRREGLHEGELEEWRDSAEHALESRAEAAARKKREAKRVRELEKELKRKDKALAEAAALLVLQKKVRAIWGDGDDDTDEGSEK
jgi:transposase-like protein